MRKIPLEMRYVAGSDDECWLWIAGRTTAGYGIMRDAKNRKNVYAHRFIWEMKNGAIPAGLEICHKCDVRNCVNPAHMFLGTRSDNMKDCVKKGRNYCPILKGEDNGFSKLTASDITEIRELRERGNLLKNLANRFNVSETTISRIALKQTWRHIQ